MTDTAPFQIRSWAADVIGVVGSVGIAAVLSLVYLAITGRFLGPAEYSDFAAGIALATLLAVVLGALTPITSVLAARYTAAGEPARVRGLIAVFLRIIVALGAVLLVASLAAGTEIARTLQLRSSVVLPAAVLVYFGIAASSVIRAALRGSQRFGEYGWGVVAEAAVRLSAGVAFLFITRVAVAAMVPYAIGTLVASIAGLRVLRRQSDRSERVRFSEVTMLLGPTAVLLATMAVYQNIDVLLVKRFFPADDAGIYGAAAGLARTMALLLMPLEALLLPRLTFLVERREDAVGPTAKLTLLFAALAAIPLLLFVVAPRLVMLAVYGSQYESAAPLLFPLAVAMLLLYFSYLAGQALISIGRPGAAYTFSVLAVAEVTAVVIWHPSLHTVANILVTTRALAFVGVAGSLWRLRRR